MATYAIGDVQGCFDALQALLQVIEFNVEQDTLWFAGDVVNRGSQSLEVLRFLKNLPRPPIVVLGNHDLHLLAIAHGVRPLRPQDTLQDILEAPDADELIYWLAQQPLLHHDKQLNFVMTHAGIAPCWDLKQAKACALEVEQALKSDPAHLLQHAFGNEPSGWAPDLVGHVRWRVIINYFTRMRFCLDDMSLDLHYKGEIAGKPDALTPWFMLPNRKTINGKIIFGHWAALNGAVPVPDVFAIDTGCAWGNCLTALRLEDQQLFKVSC